MESQTGRLLHFILAVSVEVVNSRTFSCVSAFCIHATFPANLFMFKLSGELSLNQIWLFYHTDPVHISVREPVIVCPCSLPVEAMLAFWKSLACSQRTDIL